MKTEDKREPKVTLKQVKNARGAFFTALAALLLAALLWFYVSTGRANAALTGPLLKNYLCAGDLLLMVVTAVLIYPVCSKLLTALLVLAGPVGAIALGFDPAATAAIATAYTLLALLLWRRRRRNYYRLSGRRRRIRDYRRSHRT